ncbi:hypothetical protein TNCV_28211 [Trichonephila clavipes]|uniref:Uncharacterized protein n=1 Tax=Trichonephila clavipes TaxID=2585209 RepID=A0A8X7BNC0_TRICX|nr:hypothetical protein TNCV_28211 [Trichonephila clavipes]
MVLLGVGNGSQKVECTVADPRNTNDREDRAIRRVAIGTNNVASIDSTPLTSFQTSSAIKRNHKETTDRSWLEEPTSAKTLPLTPHHQCRLDFCRCNLEFRLETCHLQ